MITPRMTGTGITVPAVQVLACANFAAAVQQSRRQFGSTDRRHHEQQVLDTFEGKVAECAFAILARAYGYDVTLDFHLYAEGQTDAGSDIGTIANRTASADPERARRLPRHRVDVKAIGANSRWLLVETHKYGAAWADFYVLARHTFSRDALRHMVCVSRELHDIPVEIVGVAHRDTFMGDDGRALVTIHRGDRLRSVPEYHSRRPSGFHGTRQFRSDWEGMAEMGPRLDAPTNYGLLASWLSDDVEGMLAYIWTHATEPEPE